MVFVKTRHMAAKRSATDNRVYSIESLYPQSGRHAWIGGAPPFVADSLSLEGRQNYRLPSLMHGQFDSAWFVETPLSDLPGDRFELVLDELIRLLGRRGRLVVRFRETKDLSVINLKQSIGRRFSTAAVVNRQWNTDDTYTIDFSIERHNFEDYQDRRWTFAVLTRGDKVEMVVRFLQSIRSLDPGHEHEILVWGPMDAAYVPYGVRASDRSYRDDVAEIARKKNDIAEAASHANLLIAHDRYTLDEGFFDGFDTFGYDFDLCAIAQRYEDGHPFPAYCALPGHKLVRAPTTIDCPEANSLWPLQFVAGGLTVVKTRALRQIRFNDLLFWCEAEDVEVAKAFRDRGLPPRMNPWSSATSHGVDRDWYTGHHFTTEEKYLQQNQLPQSAPPSERHRIMKQLRRGLRRLSVKLCGSGTRQRVYSSD